MQKTFGDLRTEAQAKLRDCGTDYECDYALYMELACYVFDTAVSVVQSARIESQHASFAERLALLTESIEYLRRLKNPMEAAWPLVVTSFGFYLQNGTSALDVAVKFSGSVQSATEIAKVFEFQSFDSSVFYGADFERWRLQSLRQYEQAFSLHLWPPAIMQRDARALVDAVHREWKAVPKNGDPDAARAIALWDSGDMTWTEIAKAIEPALNHDRKSVDAFTAKVRRYAESIGHKLRKAKAGRRKQPRE